MWIWIATNLQNFVQKDLTGVKIFQKVFGGWLLFLNTRYLPTQWQYHLICCRVHVVFGHVIEGQEVVREVEQQKVDENSRPLSEVKISSCGELVLQVRPKGSVVVLMFCKTATMHPSFLNLTPSKYVSETNCIWHHSHCKAKARLDCPVAIWLHDSESSATRRRQLSAEQRVAYFWVCPGHGLSSNLLRSFSRLGKSCKK